MAEKVKMAGLSESAGLDVREAEAAIMPAAGTVSGSALSKPGAEPEFARPSAISEASPWTGESA